jgi:hypothetical protein
MWYTWAVKRFWIIISILVVGLSVGMYMLQQRQASSVISPEAESKIATFPQPQKLLTWVDPAGFTFQYPEGIEINTHDEDSQNYAHVELIEKNNKGSIIIWAKDTTAADSAGWVKAEKSLAGGTVFDTTLGGISGKKILIASPQKSVISGVVDEGIVFYVEGIFDDSDYFIKAFDTITTSFGFSGQAADTQVSVVDEEEIIE